MMRLTKKTADGILVKENDREGALKTLYQCYGSEPMPHYANCDEGFYAMEKLAEYEDLEEQGRLLKLPCAVGDMVYCIMTSIKGTNPIIFSKKFDYSMIGCFGKFVFLTKKEAEAALKK